MSDAGSATAADHPFNPYGPETVQCRETSPEKLSKKDSKSQHQWRNFVFTMHNYTDDDIEQIKALPYRYLVFGREICPDTGRPHLQGYCELDRRLTFNTLTKGLPRGIHLEPRRGSQKQAITYCKKDDDYDEYGEPRRQGSRSDFELAQRYLREGRTVRDLKEDEECTVGALSAFERLLAIESRSGKRIDRSELLVHWIYGPGGSGKTQRAFEICGADAYRADLHDMGWYDGYSDQEGLVIDDYEWDGKNSSFKTLLQLMDIYHTRLNVKGSSVQLKAKKIVIVSQKSPWMIWPPPMEMNYMGRKWVVEEPGPEMYDKNVKLRQIMRRVTEVEGMNPPQHEQIRWPVLKNVPKNVRHELKIADDEEQDRIAKRITGF